MQLETEHKININWTQTEHKVNTEVDTISFSSSCKEYLNTTTTENNKNRLQTLLSTEWQNIDIEPLSNINFTKNHLTQISTQNKLSPDIVQHSIYAFAFDLQENNKAKNIKNDPINFFMGILRNGLPYTPPSNYESPKDKALRLYNERMLKAEQGRVETEKQAVNLAFNDWFLHLTNKQKIELLPDMFRRNVTTEKLGKNKMLEGAAKSHFEAEIWPDLKNKIISGAEINTETKVIEQGEEVG